MAAWTGEIEAEVRRFLAECRTASLATADDRGLPHAANVQYALDEAMRLIWVSSFRAAHSLHLARQPTAAVTIYAHDDAPERIHGVQLHGRCELLDGAARGEGLAVYAARFPFVAHEPYRAAVEGQGLYRLTPTWLRWIDNRRGFGFKAERGQSGA